MDEVPAEPGRAARGVPGDTAGVSRPEPTGDMPARLTIRIEGHVQGVGFRAFVRSRGNRLGLAGTATNRPDGSVEVIAEGPARACQALVGVIRDGWTPGWVTGVSVEWSRPRGDLTGFSRQ